jgi:hypothetical protein
MEEITPEFIEYINLLNANGYRYASNYWFNIFADKSKLRNTKPRRNLPRTNLMKMQSYE